MACLRSVVWVFVVALIGDGASAQRTSPPVTKRCGWFVNPTPANAWLLDREAEWTISTQGGAEAEGEWPRFKSSQWVKTNGNHGYGCACLQVIADSRTHQVSAIRSASAQNLAVCEKDRSLKAPS